jgi:hypothetical protein
LGLVVGKIRILLGASILLLVSMKTHSAIIGSSSDSSGTEDDFFVGGQYWGEFTSALITASGGSLATGVNIASISDLMSHDAMVLNLRPDDFTLTTTETSNLLSYINSGRKLLMFGENEGWPDWNQSILDLVGGPNSNIGYNGNTSPVVSNDLTAGVGSVYVPYSGIVSNGGQALFAQNFATLWGSNVLTILDVNVQSDAYWNVADNAQFGTNVANWLASPLPISPVPEPSIFALFSLGLAGLGFANRRRA